MSSLSFDLMSHSRQEFGRNLVADHDPHHVVFPQPAAFHLEIDQTDADAEEQPAQEVVDADRQRHDVVDLLRRGPAERGDVLLRHHRVVELVVLVVEFDDRARQLRALLDAQPGRQRARGDVSDDDRKRNDLNLADQLLAHVEPADEVRRHADVVEPLEQVLRNPVVEDALAFDHLVLLGVESGGVVLEMLDQRSRFRSFVKDLRLAFIDATAAAHRNVPWFVNVHWVPWLGFRFLRPRRRKPEGTHKRKRTTIRSRPKPNRSCWAAQST